MGSTAADPLPMGAAWIWSMRTILESPDPLFARLTARAAMEGDTVKQLPRSDVEQGLSAAPARAELKRTAASLPARVMRMAADLPDLNVWLALIWPEHLPPGACRL